MGMRMHMATKSSSHAGEHHHAVGEVTERLTEHTREILHEVKPKLRGWLHAAIAPVTLVAGIVLIVFPTVVFGGVSPDSLIDRINDAECKVVVTADGGFRRGAPSMLKPNVDVALAATPSVEHVVVVKRVAEAVSMTDGRDQWWHDLMATADAECPCEPMDSEDLLYLLYTSGTTAKPKGIMHTTGGYLTQVAFTHKYVFDLKPDTDVYWCAADIGWVTGHSYIVYGPLANGATSVMYEGTPDSPHKGRWWEIIEKYGVTIFYTAPTAIRTFMKWGNDIPEKFDLSSIRVLGSVGEPINPEAWNWYNRVVGKGKEVKWPTGIGARGNEGVAGQVKQTPGSIGYVELAYTKQNSLPYASIQNPAGNFVEPTMETIEAAAESAAPNIPPSSDYRISIVNARGANAYPISSFTWLLVYRNPADTAKARILNDFLRYALTEGSAAARALDYAPLPETMARQLLARIDSIGGRGGA